MTNMKCPFCQQELREIYCYNVVMGYLCPNPDCKKAEKLKGNAEFWQELIRTRKALDVTVDALNKINMRCQNTIRNHLERATIRGELCDISFYARKAIDDIDNLNKITALEQKDVK